MGHFTSLCRELPMTRRSKEIFRQKSSKRSRGDAAEPAAPTAARHAEEAPREELQGDGLRLQKVMAAAGVGSRRHCEELILAGRVDVDGRPVRKLGTKVEPSTQQVRVDGRPLKIRESHVYYLVNKPDGVVSTNSDPAGRTRVVDLVPQHDGEHLYTVGRLDMSSEGLILVTNDGTLANGLTHPKFGVEKTYVALVAGQISQEVVDKLRDGVHLAEGVARCVRVHIRKTLPQSTLLEIVLAEGKNREIRRILAKVGHKVLKLKRTAIAGVKLRDIKVGDFRRLSRDEIRQLQEASRTPQKRKFRPRVDRSPKHRETATSDVTPIVDTRDSEPRRGGGRADRPQGRRDRDRFAGSKSRRTKPQRAPGTGTIIGAE
jgi:23S rRNA pseudouridine2605 synthase